MIQGIWPKNVKICGSLMCFNEIIFSICLILPQSLNVMAMYVTMQWVMIITVNDWNQMYTGKNAGPFNTEYYIRPL